jgi:threonyl-tRNA synthetase
MIHRAILGSLERFIGILTEEYAGVPDLAGTDPGRGHEYHG